MVDVLRPHWRAAELDQCILAPGWRAEVDVWDVQGVVFKDGGWARSSRKDIGWWVVLINFDGGELMLMGKVVKGRLRWQMSWVMVWRLDWSLLEWWTWGISPCKKLCEHWEHFEVMFMLRCLHFQLQLTVICAAEGTADFFSEDFKCCFHLALTFSALGRWSCWGKRVCPYCITVTKINYKARWPWVHWNTPLNKNTLVVRRIRRIFSVKHSNKRIENSNEWVS